MGKRGGLIHCTLQGERRMHTHCREMFDNARGALAHGMYYSSVPESDLIRFEGELVGAPAKSKFFILRVVL